MGTPAAGLPHLDDHELHIDAPSAAVFRALKQYVDASLARADGHLVARLLGTDPPSGFAVVEEVPDRLVRLAGQHRFSRYQLVFELDVVPDGTVLRASSYAEFPGLHGRAYRAAVVGTRGHVVATRHLLEQVRRRVAQEGESSASSSTDPAL
jgi:hypothetical protein